VLSEIEAASIYGECNLAGDIEWREYQFTGTDFSAYDVCCVSVCGLAVLFY